jgi:hypothetical protein
LQIRSRNTLSGFGPACWPHGASSSIPEVGAVSRLGHLRRGHIPGAPAYVSCISVLQGFLVQHYSWPFLSSRRGMPCSVLLCHCDSISYPVPSEVLPCASQGRNDGSAVRRWRHTLASTDHRVWSASSNVRGTLRPDAAHQFGPRRLQPFPAPLLSQGLPRAPPRPLDFLELVPSLPADKPLSFLRKLPLLLDRPSSPPAS